MTDSVLAPVAALTLPDPVAMTTSANRALGFIKAFTIASPEDYALAGEELQAIKRRQKEIEGQRTGITGPINKALKAVNDLFRGPSELLDQAETHLKTTMLTWSREQQRIADEQRRQAEEAAQAERDRLAKETAAAWYDAQAKQAEAQQLLEQGNEAAAAQATAEAQRAQAVATSAAASAEMIVAPVAKPDAPKAKGISTSTRIDFEVTNLHMLVMHIAQHPELIGLLRADDIRLRAYVKGLGAACKLPGVAVKEIQTMAARAA